MKNDCQSVRRRQRNSEKMRQVQKHLLGVSFRLHDREWMSTTTCVAHLVSIRDLQNEQKKREAWSLACSDSCCRQEATGSPRLESSVLRLLLPTSGNRLSLQKLLVDRYSADDLKNSRGRDSQKRIIQKFLLV
jgi:hypothetical protein